MDQNHRDVDWQDQEDDGQGQRTSEGAHLEQDTARKQPEELEPNVSAAQSNGSGIKNRRFKAAINATVAAQRTALGTTDTLQAHSYTSGRRKYRWLPGSYASEPGIDARQQQPELEKRIRPVTIQTVDYSPTGVQMKTLNNDQLKSYIESERPAWAKCRWINVNGASWDVVRQLALEYNLHPLAVEDCLHTSARSKSEYYQQHLFVHAAVHTLLDPNPSSLPLLSPPLPRPTLLQQVFGSSNGVSANSGQQKPTVPRNEGNVEAGVIPQEFDGGDEESIAKPKKSRTWNSSVMDLGMAAGTAGKASLDTEREVVRELTREYKVRIRVDKLSMFVLRDGTLITIFSGDGSFILEPIFDRLRSAGTLIRSSAHVSMLLQAILDLVIDEALEVVEAFRSTLTTLEARVLIRPEMETVRHLHILSGELLLLKRTLTPLLSLVHGIRNHDEDHNLPPLREGDPPPRFISPQAKVYLSDVLDHIDSVLSSLELFANLAQNLIDFTFNVMGFSTNEAMRQLSLVTIMFLPLTFLTGYFGMNFRKSLIKFHAVTGSDIFFWELAVPITTATFVLLMYSSIKHCLKGRKRALVAARTTRHRTRKHRD